MSVYEERESYAVSRAGGLGGTDMAAILGMSPWKAPIDVYAAKINPESQPELDKECLTWGRLLEPIVRERYAQKFDACVIAPSRMATYFPNHRTWDDSVLPIGREPWMLGAPDGWIPSVKNGLEVKCSSRKSDEWGSEGSDEVPAHYLTQVAWYMAVCEANGWNFAVLFSGNTLAQYRVNRDLDLERDMIEAGRSFWYDFVLKQVEPPIDQTESYGRYLARKFSLNTGAVIKNPSPELVEWTLKMKVADDEMKAAEERKREANNHLRALVGDAQKALTPYGSVGWIRPEEKPDTDWHAAAIDLSSLYDDARAGNAIAAAAVVAKHTHPKQNDAYLRAWWRK